MGWQRLPISAFLRNSRDWVEPEPDRIYQQIRVRLWGKGLTLRARVPGASIAAHRQLRASAGQFLISRIDARHGAFGIVPNHLDGALVSNDFPCYDIDEHIVLPRYLEWYTRTDQFAELCRRASEGSTNRVRLKEDRFMAMEIHRPPIGEQQAIVAKLDVVKGLADNRTREAQAARRDARVIVSNAFRRIVDRVPRLPMANVAPLVRRTVDVDPEVSYPELGVRSFGKGTFHKPHLDGTDLGTKRIFLIRAGDLLFNIVFAWEGAVAVAQPRDDGRVGSHRFLTCVPEPTIAISEFLFFYFLTPEGMDKLGNASPGGAGRNRTLGLKKLDAIDVPVPDLDRQEWFCRLYTHYRQMTMKHDGVHHDMGRLMSAVLHRYCVF